MTQLPNELSYPVIQAEDVTQNNLSKLVGCIDQLQESLEKVSSEYRQSRIWRKLVRGQLVYLAVCKVLRKIVSSAFGIRVGGVLIGAALSAAFFLVLTQSWLACFCGFVLGAVLFSCFLYLPQDDTFPIKAVELQTQLAECKTIEDNFHRITAELTAAREKHRQIIESQQYRLRKLANRNWKAMRGGEPFVTGSEKSEPSASNRPQSRRRRSRDSTVRLDIPPGRSCNSDRK